jgi:hypothetical protein
MFIPLLIVALATMACGITINLPFENVRTIPTVVEDLTVPLPESSGSLQLTLAFGAGELYLSPGAETALVEGTATYNVDELKPKVRVDGSSVRVETGNLEVQGLPNFRSRYEHEWDLKLLDTPMDLTINAGAYKGIFDLGGLSLQSLRITDGASDVEVDFSTSNHDVMDTLRYETGASSVRLNRLANANFDRLEFKGGAGDYTLDFSGDLQRDATVTIDTGVSSVAVIVPQNVNARLLFDGGLSNVDISGDWERDGNDYVLNGQGPRLTINVNMGAGNLELRNR